MYKLEWDCDMEEEAYEAIKDCLYQEDWEHRALNLDEYTNPDGFPDIPASIEAVLDEWWSRPQDIVQDEDNLYIDSRIQHFAKMIFSKATKIGCAYSICGAKMDVLCLYDEKGDRIGHKMWYTGKACKRASDCKTFADSECDDGLCVKDPSSDDNNANANGGNVDDTTDAGNDYATTDGNLDVTDDAGNAQTTTDMTGTNDQCPGNSAMTDQARDAVLKIHNKFRSSLAHGLEMDKLGEYAPKAAKMLKMIYDCDLEASAEKHAEECIFDHSDTPGVGQNLWSTSELNLDKVKAVKYASHSWWEELKKFGYGSKNTITQEMFERPDIIGHYTQMAWDTSYKLGCAVQHCEKMTFVVCYYSPGGNILDAPIYAIGEPCQTDGDCPGSYTCSSAEGLCNVV
ncbi:SCP-like protein [Oesophagostomum dentatum]|uniref:SCP-like protein n=1 Tax=Oesophagostomum dentatum TaxID=61180 RepID=A0A0B1SYG6_OESDE|nr:SCP-like protein [Oesophagostomum dentatum]